MPTSASWRTAVLLLAAFACALCTGCASGPNPADPWENSNRSIYNFNEGLDRVALKPLADGYVKVVPQPIRTGIGNGFNNLSYFNVVFNDLLQAKWNQGLGDAGRMAVNSTIGIAGFFDVATPWSLPAHRNDFGITLRKWGAGPGPYVVLPLLGPSTLTDTSSIPVKYVCTPTTWLDLPLYITIPMYAVDTVDFRSRFDSVVRFRNDTAVDPYVFTREAYLQYRQEQAHDGKQPATGPSLYDEDEEPATPTTSPAAPSGR